MKTVKTLDIVASRVILLTQKRYPLCIRQILLHPLSTPCQRLQTAFTLPAKADLRDRCLPPLH